MAGKKPAGQPSTWSMIIIAFVAVLFFNAFAGTPSSPLEKMLHMHQAPKYLPLAFAAVFGLALGVVFNRRVQRGKPGAADASGGESRPAGHAAAKPATRGRHAVPRSMRREQERQERRAAELAQRERRSTEAAERAAREAAERARSEARKRSGPRARLASAVGRLRPGAGRGAPSNEAPPDDPARP